MADLLEIKVVQSHDGNTPAWVASARGHSCGSEYSPEDAVAALVELLLKTGAATQDEVERPVACSD